jgi:hypothetical protein
MCDMTVTEPNENRKPPLALLKRSEARRRRNYSRTQEWKELKDNPDHPQLVWINGSGYYVEAGYDEYLAKLVENGRGSGPDGMPDRLAEALENGR